MYESEAKAKAQYRLRGLFKTFELERPFAITQLQTRLSKMWKARGC